ncbi:GntR family transcriptional regulator [Paracoccus amoyensis]|uniref:GntR family transcriptional regulator n=1 Tax=Paracoccus amoyensis TaxID=2760093 RepID=UPI0031B5B0F8
MTEYLPGGTSPKAQLIADEVRRRIATQQWQQGQRIPDEADLAVEFGAARATVNKALQVLADEGLLERKRRAGTRVVVNPARKATFTIPIIREQIEKLGQSYSYRVFTVRRGPPGNRIVTDLGVPASAPFVHLQAVHYGDGQPFQFEDRWINLAAVAGMENLDFKHINANEWLVRNAQYLRADIEFSAENATAREAQLLGATAGMALLVLSRNTWNDKGLITSVRIACRPGFSMKALD